MKYLNRREEFMKSYSRIVTEKERYEPKEAIVSINEDSGPFANDIGWGDSLLGRLINSTIRKAKIGINLTRMKAVESRLKEAMDDLLLTSGIAELDPEEKSEYAKCLIATYLKMLEEGVEKGEPMQNLLNLTDAAIEAVERQEILEGKEELLRQLREWKKYLKQFKEEESQSKKETSEGEKTPDKTSIYLKNFSNIFKMMLIYQGIEKEKGEYYRMQGIKKGQVGTSGTAGTAATATAAPAATGTSGTSGTSVSGPEDADSNAGEKEAQNVKDAQNESILLRYEGFLKKESIAGSAGKIAGKIWKFFNGEKDGKNISPEELKKQQDEETANLWKAMNPLYRLFTQSPGVLSKDGPLGVAAKNPESLRGDDYNKYKSNIDKIYDFVRSANGINEDVHEFLGQHEKIGKAIAGIYEVTKSKPDGSFKQYPGSVGDIWDELTEAIANFNETMEPVMTLKSKWNVGDTIKYKSENTGEEIEKEIVRIEGKKLVLKNKKGEEYTKFMSEVEKVDKHEDAEKDTNQEIAKESRILKYSRFAGIFEADESEDVPAEEAPAAEEASPATETPTEDKDGQVTPWKNPNSITKVKDWWGKNMDLKKWMMEKTEVEKVRINIEKKMAASKDSVVIQGMDPVLEIVKVFNRAYKLHTTQVIPTGRSGGKVSNKTFMEYHCFGTGTPANAGEQGGPYRNIAIFNQWEDCVNDVLKDKRYQKIFNVGTRLKVGDQYIEKAGMNLRKFMTDLLDGEELYRSGGKDGQGAQAKFLDKYFGYKADPEGKDTFWNTSDRDEMYDNAGKIKSPKVMLLEGSTAVKYENPEDLKGSFFIGQISKGGDSDKHWYFYIQDIKDGWAYLSMARTGHFMKEYLKAAKGTNPDLNSTGGGFKFKDEKKNDSGIYRIYATKVRIDQLLSKDGTLKMQSFDLGYIKKKDKEEGGFSSTKTSVDNSSTNEDYEVPDTKTKYSVNRFWHVVDEENKRLKAPLAKLGSAMKEPGGYREIARAVEKYGVKMERT